MHACVYVRARGLLSRREARRESEKSAAPIRRQQHASIYIHLCMCSSKRESFREKEEVCALRRAWSIVSSASMGRGGLEFSALECISRESARHGKGFACAEKD